GWAPANNPCSPKYTSSTVSGSGTHVKPTSTRRAKSAGLSASLAPAATAASMGPRERLTTHTSNPAFNKFFVMGKPIFPNPTKPTFIPLLLSRHNLPPFYCIGWAVLQANGAHPRPPNRTDLCYNIRVFSKEGSEMAHHQDHAADTPSRDRSRQWRTVVRGVVLAVGLLLYAGMAGALFAAGAGLGFVGALVQDQPVLEREEMIRMVTSNHQTSYAYFRDGTLIGQLRTDEDRRNVTLDQVPEHLIQAFIATEDRSFFENPGIDIRGLARAIFQQITNAPVQTGGSTITQQLIKTAVLEDPSQTYERKAKEILLSLRLTRIMSKEEILTAYLNEIYFGPTANKTHAYGVQAAARGIFGVDAEQLNLAQAAYLAGIPQNPAAYSPFLEGGLERGLERQKTVLNRMLEVGYITEEEYEEALSFDIAASLAKPTPKAFDRYPALTMEVEKRAAEILLQRNGIQKGDPGYQEALEGARQEVLRGGYRIFTTIDKAIYDRMQEIAQDPKNFGPNRDYTAADERKIPNAPEQVG